MDEFPCRLRCRAAGADAAEGRTSGCAADSCPYHRRPAGAPSCPARARTSSRVVFPLLLGPVMMLSVDSAIGRLVRASGPSRTLTSVIIAHGGTRPRISWARYASVELPANRAAGEPDILSAPGWRRSATHRMCAAICRWMLTGVLRVSGRPHRAGHRGPLRIYGRHRRCARRPVALVPGRAFCRRQSGLEQRLHWPAGCRPPGLRREVARPARHGNVRRMPRSSAELKVFLTAGPRR